MIILDMLAHDDWSRPVYFTTFAGQSSYMGLEKYFRLEGLTYRLVPLNNNQSTTGLDTRVGTDIMYNNMVNKFRWGNMGSKVYLDENVRRMASQLRQVTGTLAQALIEENKKDSALKVLNLCVDSIPNETYPYDVPMVLIAYCYYEAGDIAKADKLTQIMFDAGESKLRYFHSLEDDARMYYGYEREQMQSMLEKLTALAEGFDQRNMVEDFHFRLAAMLKEHIIVPKQQ